MLEVEFKLRLALTNIFWNLAIFSIGFIYISKITSYPKDLYEAADVDGAGPFRKIFAYNSSQITAILSLLLWLDLFGILINLKIFFY